MIPGTYNLDLYRGDTGRWQFKLWADTAKKQAADLTDVIAVATVRDKATGGKYCQHMDCSVTLPNIIDMVLSSIVSGSLPAKGVWDVQLTYPGGDVATVLKGNMSALQDVTYPNAATRIHGARRFGIVR